MKIKTILIILFAFVILSSIVIAEESVSSLGTFEPYKPVILRQVYNGTGCNITSVVYPNSTAALSTITPMTKAGVEYSYTLAAGKVVSNGVYTVSGECDTIVWAYDFTVSPSGGVENNTIMFLILIISATVLLILSFVFENLLFSVIAGLLFMVAGTYSMIYGFGDVTTVYTRMISVIIILLGAIISIIAAIDLGDFGFGEGSMVNDEED